MEVRVMSSPTIQQIEVSGTDTVEQQPELVRTIPMYISAVNVNALTHVINVYNLKIFFNTN